MQPVTDLVYDVGLHDGADTAHYLTQGFRVVAIEENPAMVERAAAQFAGFIQSGRLTLLNLGIADNHGQAEFWVSSKSEWSSFDRTIAGRDGTEHHPVSVTTVPFSDILKQYGIPHYCKIDIEARDRMCLEALRGLPLPDYLSVEAECVDDSTVLSDGEALTVLNLLHELGYRRFRAINQGNGWQPLYPVSPVARFWAKCRRRLHPLRPHNLPFGSSGPCPWEHTSGWMDLRSARAAYLSERHAYFQQARPLYSFWFDWHVCH
jgi:FkbM family methyltransferase